MGCGNSISAPVVEGEVPQEKENSPEEVARDDIDSNPMFTPDHTSQVVTPPGVNKHNGTSIQPQPVDNHHVDTPIMTKKLVKKDFTAFEVAPSGEDDGKSLIKKHPPKKFQKLEEIQITPEELVAKQNSAHQRRQKIMHQRVQSAKLRSAKVRSIHSANSTEHDENGDNVIEGPDDL